MKTAVILNPKAGTNPNKSGLVEVFKKIYKEIKPDATDQLDVLFSQYAGHATELAQKVSQEGYDLCIAAGGDGTMNETAKGLLGSQTALGLIPLGSGNGLARHLNIPLDPETAFRRMVLGTSGSMDAGMANGHWFFLTSGIGFEGVVAHKFATKKKRGFLQYLISSTEMFLSYKPITLTSEVDDIPFETTVFTSTFANGSQYGNGAKIAPGAAIDDGILQLIKIKPFPLISGPGIFMRLMNGSLNASSYFSSEPFKRLHLRGEKELLGHVDGEPVSFGKEITIEVKPNALRIQTPSMV